MEKKINSKGLTNKDAKFLAHYKEKEILMAKLFIANGELATQMKDKQKHDVERIIAHKELSFQNKEKEMRAAELSIINKELAYQNDEKEKHAAELIIAHKELSFQNKEKEMRAAELSIINKELAYQNDEKEKRAAELIIANKELAYQNEEKEKRAAELIIANKELTFQNNEKEKRAAELIIANKELTFQNNEKEKRAAELIIANKELAYQNEEKEKRAAELIIANKELTFQNNEKEKRAAELIIANKELSFQNKEKEKRAAELIIANKELAYQNEEKEKRAAELIIANKELIFQNREKEKRAAELIVANEEITYQNKKLHIQNKELEQFTYIASHDLQEPLRTLISFTELIQLEYTGKIDQKADKYLNFIAKSSERMQELVKGLLDYARIGKDRKLTWVDCNQIIDEVLEDLTVSIKESNTKIKVHNLPKLNAYVTELRQLFQNLISNSIKFRKRDGGSEIIISVIKEKNDWLFSVQDNGIGIAVKDQDKIFTIFKRLHNRNEYDGVGIGLAHCKKIVELHNGAIWIKSELDNGSIFKFTIPNI